MVMPQLRLVETKNKRGWKINQPLYKNTKYIK